MCVVFKKHSISTANSSGVVNLCITVMMISYFLLLIFAMSYDGFAAYVVIYGQEILLQV